MANVDAAFGARPVRHLTGGQIRTNEYKIASGTSSRHLQALSEILVTELKKIGLDTCRIEGKDSNDWKLVDTNDVIVHIFHPEKRKFYDLENMWSEEIPKEKAMI